MLIKDFPPALLLKVNPIDYLNEFMVWSPYIENKVTDFTTICINLDNGFFCSAVLHKSGPDIIGATYSQYTDADNHFTLSLSMYLGDRCEYKVFFCRDNKWNETILNDVESAYKLVNYLFGKLQDNAELWV